MITLHALSLLGGVLLALGAVALPGWPEPGNATLTAALALALALAWSGRWRAGRLAAPLGTLLLGWCWAGWHLQQYQAALVDLPGERVLVTARVDSLPRYSGADASFVARLTVLRGGASPPPARAVRELRARIHWRNAPSLSPGEHWQLLLALQPPPLHFNPGRRALAWPWLRDGLHGAGRVLPSRLNQRQHAAPLSVDGLRAALSARLRQLLVERDTAALAVALAVGDTQHLSAEQWRVFNATGITHLIAISGLHVTLFALLGAAAARRCWRLCLSLQRWRRETVAGLLACLAAGGYALLAGFEVPAQRTLIMLVAWYAMRGMARPSLAAPTLSVALLAVLLMDPLAPLGAGFWLSFIAAAVLIHAVGTAGGWRSALRVQLIVTLGLLPATLALAGNVSLIGLMLNFIAIPLFTLVLVPLVLMATALAKLPLLAALLPAVLTWLHGLLWPALLWLADRPFALWRLQPPLWWLLLCVPALLWLLWPWRWPLRASACLLLLPALFPRHAPLRDGEFLVTALDVGRGLAVIVRTRDHALLYDNGETWSSGGAVSRGTVLPALRSYRLRSLDQLYLPRLDADRSAGVLAVRAELPVATLLAPAVAAPPPEFSACQHGGWRWNSVEFRIVDAEACTLRVVGGDGTTLLLAAELSPAGLQRLVGQGLAQSGIVLPPRRDAGLGAVSGARWVLVSQSARDSAAPAAQRMLYTWRQRGTQPLVTAELGAIELRAGAGLQLRHYRASPTKPY